MAKGRNSVPRERPRGQLPRPEGTTNTRVARSQLKRMIAGGGGAKLFQNPMVKVDALWVLWQKSVKKRI